jgi:hypothetical protein
MDTPPEASTPAPPPAHGPVGPLFLSLGFLGLLLGLGDLSRVMRLPVERLEALQKAPPTPRSALWAAAYQQPSEWLASADRFIIGLSVAALIAAALALAAALGPAFRLVKPGHEGNGRPNMGAHLEVGRLARVAVGVAFSLWLAGALFPLALVVGGGQPSLVGTLLGGLPAWCGDAGSAGLLVLALVLVPALWWLWGPRGPLFPAEGVSLSEVLATGFLAAAAAMPAFAVLYGARGWIPAAAGALTAVDRAGWQLAFWLAAVLPVAACLWIAGVAALYRPGALASGRTSGLALGGLLGVALVIAADRPVRSHLARLGVGATSLAAELRLDASPMNRFALLLPPRGGAVFSVTEDGSSEGPQDRITSAGPARAAVQRFLEDRNYRNTLALRAYSYLNSCRALDWETTRSLQLSLEAMQRAPSPLIAQYLLEKLGECPITPENRRVLDAIADPAMFAWPEQDGRRRLGAAYLRFGDPDRARQYLLKAGLNQDEARVMLGGVSPLADGRVSGRVTILGKAQRNVRLGLVSARHWRLLAGYCRPIQWSLVLDAAHTDAEGRFEFRAVPEGRYVLIVTGGGIGPLGGSPVVEASPGAFTVDRYRPAVTLPPFDIRFEKPTRAPRDADLGNTVSSGAGPPAV